MDPTANENQKPSFYPLQTKETVGQCHQFFIFFYRNGICVLGITTQAPQKEQNKNTFQYLVVEHDGLSYWFAKLKFSFRSIRPTT